MKINQYEQTSPRAWVLDVALAIFIAAGISDVVDGYLARRHNQITSLGRILDPVVDKVLVCGAFAFFAGGGFIDEAGKNVTYVQMWMVALLFGRELLVTGFRGFSEAQGTAFAATSYGKAKMFVQAVTAGFLLYSVAHPSLILPANAQVVIRLVLVWATVVATALSMIVYLDRIRRVLVETPRA
jgi:CDP-diacylglycerol--glycerol-3-phosphate 3-phosphatidyltransferase